MLIAGLAMVFAGALLAALILGLATSTTSQGASRHGDSRRIKQMRVYHRHNTESDRRHLAAAVEFLAFAHRWAPYGGAEDTEILVTFGLTPSQFVQRVRRAATYPAALDQLNLSPADLARLHAYIEHSSLSPRPEQIAASSDPERKSREQ